MFLFIPPIRRPFIRPSSSVSIFLYSRSHEIVEKCRIKKVTIPVHKFKDKKGHYRMRENSPRFCFGCNFTSLYWDQ
ncbi:hypothetical protein EYC80_005194 [Monilinia laxa]|uniref:Uncharacterized protein n=1 Tax=Monilinia laxa TaxID=61186 RepID=A0A5N6KJQ9_MONLA|nr:hypothetical protein EYC80_005194 [Monilinia laxa]